MCARLLASSVGGDGWKLRNAHYAIALSLILVPPCGFIRYAAQKFNSRVNGNNVIAHLLSNAIQEKPINLCGSEVVFLLTHQHHLPLSIINYANRRIGYYPQRLL